MYIDDESDLLLQLNFAPKTDVGIDEAIAQLSKLDATVSRNDYNWCSY